MNPELLLQLLGPLLGSNPTAEQQNAAEQISDLFPQVMNGMNGSRLAATPMDINAFRVNPTRGYQRGGEVDTQARRLWQSSVDLPFVQRWMAPSLPPLMNDKGQEMSHQMAAEVDDDGDWYVFPRIIERGGELVDLKDNRKALAHAKRTGEYIQAPNMQVALHLSKNYKKYQKGGTAGEDDYDPYQNTLYVSDPDDPRLKTYQDSLYSYNLGQNMLNIMRGVDGYIEVPIESQYGQAAQKYKDELNDNTKQDSNPDYPESVQLAYLMDQYQKHGNKAILPEHIQPFLPDPDQSVMDLINGRDMLEMLGIKKERFFGNYHLPVWKKPEREVKTKDQRVWKTQHGGFAPYMNILAMNDIRKAQYGGFMMPSQGLIDSIMYNPMEYLQYGGAVQRRYERLMKRKERLEGKGKTDTKRYERIMDRLDDIAAGGKGRSWIGENLASSADGALTFLGAGNVIQGTDFENSKMANAVGGLGNAFRGIVSAVAPPVGMALQGASMLGSGIGGAGTQGLMQGSPMFGGIPSMESLQGQYQLPNVGQSLLQGITPSLLGGLQGTMPVQVPTGEYGGYAKKYPMGGMLGGLNGMARQLQNVMGYKDNSPFNKAPMLNIDGNNISMNNVSRPLMLLPDKGMPTMAAPNSGNYIFPGASNVLEIPMQFGWGGRKKYQMGGPVQQEAPMQPIQTEKGEFIIHLDGTITPVNASKKHSQMDDDEITDIIPAGSYIASADKTIKMDYDDAEDIMIGYKLLPYDEMKKGKVPEEVTFASLWPGNSKKSMTPAELANRIRRMFKIVDYDDDKEYQDVFRRATNRENLQSRLPYLQALIEFNEDERPLNPMEYQFGGHVMKMQGGGDWLQLALSAAPALINAFTGSNAGGVNPQTGQPNINPMAQHLMLGSVPLNTFGLIQNVNAQQNALGQGINDFTGLGQNLNSLAMGQAGANIFGRLGQQTQHERFSDIGQQARLANFNTRTPGSVLDAAATPNYDLTALASELGPRGFGSVANNLLSGTRQQNAQNRLRQFGEDRNLSNTLMGQRNALDTYRQQFNIGQSEKDMQAQNAVTAGVAGDISSLFGRFGDIQSSLLPILTGLNLDRARLAGQIPLGVSQNLFNVGSILASNPYGGTGAAGGAGGAQSNPLDQFSGSQYLNPNYLFGQNINIPPIVTPGLGIGQQIPGADPLQNPTQIGGFSIGQLQSVCPCGQYDILGNCTC